MEEKLKKEYEEQESYLILSREELAYILKVLKRDNFPGIEQNILAGLTDEQQLASLFAAENALISRGFIQLIPQEKKVKIDQVIFAFIAVALTSKKNLSIFISRSNCPIERFIYFLHSNIIVEVSCPSPNIFKFNAYDKHINAINRIMVNLALSSIASKSYSFNLPVSCIQKICEIIQSFIISSHQQNNKLQECNIKNAIISFLSQYNNFDKNMITNFSASLSATTLFSLIIYNEEENPPQSFYIIEGGGSIWFIEQNLKNDIFSISSSSPDQIKAFLKNKLST